MSKNDGATGLIVKGIVGIIAIIVALGAAIFGKKKYDENINEAKEEGLKEGYRIGHREAVKKFADIMKKNYNVLYGTFALSLYVARIDNELSAEEKAVIQEYFGRPDAAWFPGEVQRELKKIYESVVSGSMSFETIKKSYIDNFTKSELQGLNEFIKDIIWADDILVQEERDFLENEWVPYFNIKAEQNIDINFYTDLEN